MLERLARDWPVWIMLIGLICFVIYAFINSFREQKKLKETKKEISQ